MPKWIAKPRVVEAWHFTSTDVFPGWLCAAFLDGTLVRDSANRLQIKLPGPSGGGTAIVKEGDFVVRYSDGVIVSYYHDDFLNEFEPAAEPVPDRG